MAPFPGDILLKLGDQFVGAVGVSGEAGDEDEYCALFGSVAESHYAGAVSTVSRILASPLDFESQDKAVGAMKARDACCRNLCALFGIAHTDETEICLTRLYQMVDTDSYTYKKKGKQARNAPRDVTTTALWILLDSPRPIFGICFGNQLLALAAGAKMYKRKYGNCGMNHPAIDLRTGRCYISPQNHGFAVDADSFPPMWKPLDLNANGLTNEGSVCSFTQMPVPLILQDSLSYQRKSYKKVLLVGSGGLSIGQAGEFDYSGSQCIKALKEECIEVILINPNIATVQTSQEKTEYTTPSADRVYFLPIRPSVVMDVIHKEKPDGIIVSMGGQTALNVGVELWNAGLLQKAGVELFGTQIPEIEATEDREIFSSKLKEIDETIALSYSANSIEEALVAANKIGCPVLIRAASALGGLGSGFASNDQELKDQPAKAFSNSAQILIDQESARLEGTGIRIRSGLKRQLYHSL